MLDEPLDAGPVSAVLAQVGAALRGEGATDVPCGTCTACCTSAQFVHVGPDEVDALAHIPRELLFPAPGLPKGHVLLGYDDRGRCPMLGDAGCTIYEHRPRTCRTYDCRVFALADLDPAEDGKPAIAERTRRWRLATPTEADRARLAAVRAAAAHLRAHPELAPGPRGVLSETRLAVLAVAAHAAFLDPNRPPTDDAVRAALADPA